MSWEYEVLRQLADSWGLVLSGAIFLMLTGWTFRRHAPRDHARAARMIFDTKEQSDG